MLFDTHAHLCAQQFDVDREQAIQRAKDAGVALILEAGATADYCESAAAMAEVHEGIVFAVGVHPHDAKGADKGYLSRFEALAKLAKCVAVGEIGLDYHYDFSPRDVQQRVFEQQLELAAKLGLPVIIHDREAHKDVLDRLSAYKGKLEGVMHCYSGSREDAKKYLDLGFYLGFDGPITFKNARNPIEVASYVPLDRILTETDCPYLTPEPLRGRRNEPANVRYVVEKLASIKDVPSELAAQVTFANGKRLFKIP